MSAKSMEIRRAADEESVGEWGFLAWVLWPVALLVVLHSVSENAGLDARIT